jgi:hypothetical protein
MESSNPADRQSDTPDEEKFEIFSDNEVILTWRPATEREERKAA